MKALSIVGLLIVDYNLTKKNKELFASEIHYAGEPTPQKYKVVYSNRGGLVLEKVKKKAKQPLPTRS